MTIIRKYIKIGLGSNFSATGLGMHEAYLQFLRILGQILVK